MYLYSIEKSIYHFIDGGMDMKKFITYFVLATILLSMPMKVNAATEISNEGATVTSKMEGSASFIYPHEGREYKVGPEKAMYYKLYYDANGVAKYGDIIRLADHQTIERVYPDGSYEDYIVPELTKKQKTAFYDKYNPIKVKERQEVNRKKEEAKLEKESRLDFENLVKENLLTTQSGDNYILYTYTKPDSKVFKDVVSISSDIHFTTTVENPYTNKRALTSLKKKIVTTLESHDLFAPLKISIVPFSNTDFSNGFITYDKCKEFKDYKGEYGLHIVLFNNTDVSMEKQFKIQFKSYLEERNYIY